MKKISAEIMADSICNGHRITTMLLTYPRFIHSEVMTHRMFSRNSASSRAIPFERMVKMIEEDPFFPIAWQKNHKGMQGTEYFTGTCKENFLKLDRSFGYDAFAPLDATELLKKEWLEASYIAVEQAKTLNFYGVTKQLCNRLLEPFMWHTALITFTEISNFFKLRCPQYRSYDGDSKVLFRSKKDFLKFKGCPNDSSDILYFLKHNESQAEIHIQALAESMWDAMNESTPRQLEAGMWHYPFHENMPFKVSWEDAIKISVARCARLSYMTFDGEIDYEKDIRLHDQLLKDKHYSPFEHCARAMDEDEYSTFFKGQVDCYYDNLLNKEILEYAPKETYGWCNNFRGWIQYRYLIENKQ